MGTQDNVKIVQDIYAAFGQGNIPAILNAFADDVQHYEPPAGHPPFRGTYRGREEVGALFQGMHEAVEVEQFEPREFFAEGDAVAAVGYYRFRAKATGRTYETDWVMVWRFKNGKVMEWKTYKDSAAEAAALRGA